MQRIYCATPAPFKGRINIGEYSSLRKRMRAVARDRLAPIVPTEKAKMRHAWYRRQKANDALRELMAAE